MNNQYPYYGWQPLDYLGGSFLGLVAAAIAMLMFAHPWYALYLAASALVVMFVAFLFFVYVAVRYGVDEEDMERD